MDGCFLARAFIVYDTEGELPKAIEFGKKTATQLET
jgi:hypothetical protein